MGFSKLLNLSKTVLEQSKRKDYFEAKLRELIQGRMVKELEDRYRLTSRGRLFVDNIYYFMLDDEERTVIDKEMKIVEFDSMI